MIDHGLTPENLLASLPPALQQDRKMVGLATAISEKLSMRMEEIDGLIIYPNIDGLSEELLDILAYDFKVDWWDGNYSLEEKIQTIKDNWRVHRQLGTKASVETAIRAIYPATEVQEWWEYGGKPYHFKLLIDAIYENIDPERHESVLGRVDYYKNVRSHMDSVEYTARPNSSCRVFAGVAPAGIGMQISAEVKVYGMG